MSIDLGQIPEFPPVELRDGDWRDGLAFRAPNWLGDAVMALPALLQSRKLIPETCGLFVVTPPSLTAFFASLPIVDSVITLHAAHSLWKRQETVQLRIARAGVGFLCNNSLRDPIYFRKAGVPKLFGAAARGRSPLLTQAFRFPKRRNRQMNKLHHAGRYLAMAYALGADEWNGDLPVFATAHEPEIIPREILDLAATRKLLAVGAGAAYGKAKQWPAENFHQVCRHWIDSGGTVALLGTRKEHDTAVAVAEKLPTEKVHNLAGKTDLADLIYLLQKTTACIANDSGIMHLAAALGTPGVAIFGSTDPSATGPISTNWQILYEQQECSPCFKRECPFGHYQCLQAITPDKVFEALQKIDL